MTGFRRALRLTALLWMAGYPLAIPALACLQCCAVDAAQQADAAAAADAPALACHRGLGNPPPAKEDCRMRATCSAGAAAFAAALDTQADLAPAAAADVPDALLAMHRPADRHALTRPPAADSPPPRS